MTESITVSAADRELKAKHRAMWALGDYPAVASEVIAELGPVLVSAVGIGEGDRVLDIAAGSGNASIPAARAGAGVVATDLTPELFDAGRRDARGVGVQVDWREADAEALPFDDASFDAVISCVGIMFAPHHRIAADELVRVTVAGGRIGLLSWTPSGFIGRMFATMKPYAPSPPPGVEPPPLWGDETHVRSLLGTRITDFSAHTGVLDVGRFSTGEEFRDFFKATYGPTIAVYRNIANDPRRVAALDRDLADLAREYDTGAGAMEWEYLLVTARRAG